MNINKLEDMWHYINVIGPNDVIGLYNWEIILRIKNTLRGILDEVHEPAEKLLPFDYETAKCEPERVVLINDTVDLVRLTFDDEIEDFPISAIVRQKDTKRFDRWRYGRNPDHWLKLKPKPKKLTKVWVTRVDHKKPGIIRVFEETAWLNETDARRDLAALQKSYEHTDTGISLQEREIEV